MQSRSTTTSLRFTSNIDSYCITVTADDESLPSSPVSATIHILHDESELDQNQSTSDQPVPEDTIIINPPTSLAIDCSNQEGMSESLRLPNSLGCSAESSGYWMV